MRYNTSLTNVIRRYMTYDNITSLPYISCVLDKCSIFITYYSVVNHRILKNLNHWKDSFAKFKLTRLLFYYIYSQI